MEHGVVIGGSIAGMLAARVMSDSFDRVTIIERDELTDAAAPRQGVPQGRQLHECLPLGVQIHEELFPGFMAEMQREGAAVTDMVRDYSIFDAHGWLARTASDVRILGSTRTLFEAVVRRRVMAIPNVDVVRGNAQGLAVSADRKKATGVEVKRATGVETVGGDLIVDASGRRTRSPKWLEELGFGRPDEVHIKVNLGYASVPVRVPDGVMPGDMLGLGARSRPGVIRGGIVMPIENGLHMLLATGVLRDYPPSDWNGLLEFLADAPSPLLAEIAKQCEPVGPVAPYRMPGNMRRKWEELDSRPGRFIAIGDAVGSYNPIHGQGITLAAYGASSLGRLLTAPDADLDALPQLFQDDLAIGVEWAFSTASFVDSQYEGAEFEGTDPVPPPSEFDRHLEELMTEDPDITRIVWCSFGFMAPELLESEDVKAKVAAWAGSGKRPSNNDPLRPPAVVPTAP